MRFDGFFLPYGETDGATTPRRETIHYGTRSPRVVDVARGTKVQDFPTVVRAQNDRAQFTLQGGRDLVPIIITGLSDYRRPRLFARDGCLPGVVYSLRSLCRGLPFLRADR